TINSRPLRNCDALVDSGVCPGHHLRELLTARCASYILRLCNGRDCRPPPGALPSNGNRRATRLFAHLPPEMGCHRFQRYTWRRASWLLESLAPEPLGEAPPARRPRSRSAWATPDRKSRRPAGCLGWRVGRHADRRESCEVASPAYYA